MMSSDMFETTMEKMICRRYDDEYKEKVEKIINDTIAKLADLFGVNSRAIEGTLTNINGLCRRLWVEANKQAAMEDIIKNMTLGAVSPLTLKPIAPPNPAPKKRPVRKRR